MRNGGSAEVRLYAAGVAVKGKETHYRDTPAGYKLVPFIMETHGALSRPAVELVRLLAERIAPRRAGLRGGVASAYNPYGEPCEMAKIIISIIIIISIHSRRWQRRWQHQHGSAQGPHQ